MSNYTHRIRNVVGIVALGLLMVGCAAIQSHPIAARAGDTITLAVGSADGMNTGNITLEYFSDSAPATPIDITSYIQQIFRLYPDKTSRAWQEETTATAARSSHGAWLTTIAVELPDQASGLLPVGTGHLEITTNSPSITYPRFDPDINNVNISLEILPGSGSPNPLAYANSLGGTDNGSYGWLKPKKQVVIKPPVPVEGTAYDTPFGAIELIVNAELRTNQNAVIADADIRVISDDQQDKEQYQMQTLWSRSGDQFTIMLVSPIGLYAYQGRVSILSSLRNPTYNITGTPSLTSITYYDLNGVATTGPTPAVVVE